jgi:hypothetical protein
VSKSTASPTVEKPTVKEVSQTPMQWWQWIWVYPTLIISLSGSIPTFIEKIDSISLGKI